MDHIVYGRVLLCPRTAIAAALFILAAAASAQSDDAGGPANEEPEIVETPTIRQVVFERLAAAQQCIEEEDFACAMRELGRLGTLRNLNPLERAQLHSFYGIAHYYQDDYDAAIRAYEQVVALEGLPVGVRAEAMWFLAQLYMQEERYADTVAMLDRWFEISESPGPLPYMRKAQAHYQLGEYRQGLPAIEAAIRIHAEQGRPTDQDMYRLLTVYYTTLENYRGAIGALHVLVDHWPGKDYVVQLAGMYSEVGDELAMVALYEAAYEAGWLGNDQELVTLARMLMSVGAPYKAAVLLEDAIGNGTVAATERNWRLLAQAWVLARDDDRAIGALQQASALSADGMLDLRLAETYQQLASWERCAEAARRALDRGGLERVGSAHVVHGICLTFLGRHAGARVAFDIAAKEEHSAASAREWLVYLDEEEGRLEMIAGLRMESERY